MGEQEVLLVLGKSKDTPWERYDLIFPNRYLSETQRFNIQD
jgi:hypothetical protein